jgi:hypothetical protein
MCPLCHPSVRRLPQSGDFNMHPLSDIGRRARGPTPCHDTYGAAPPARVANRGQGLLTYLAALELAPARHPP